MSNFYHKYWTQFLSDLAKREDFPLKSIKASEKNWMTWTCFGRPGFKLIISIDENGDWLCCNFGIDNRDQKHHFPTLKAQKEVIEKSTGSKLRWDPQGNERSNTQAILTRYKVDVNDRSQWPEQHAWLLDQLEKMYFSFKLHVESLPDI